MTGLQVTHMSNGELGFTRTFSLSYLAETVSRTFTNYFVENLTKYKIYLLLRATCRIFFNFPLGPTLRGNSYFTHPPHVPSTN